MSEAGSSDGYDEMSCSQEDTSDPEEEIFDSESSFSGFERHTVAAGCAEAGGWEGGKPSSARPLLAPPRR